jgi:TolA-binding protein
VRDTLLVLLCVLATCSFTTQTPSPTSIYYSASPIPNPPNGSYHSPYTPSSNRVEKNLQDLNDNLDNLKDEIDELQRAVHDRNQEGEDPPGP